MNTNSSPLGVELPPVPLYDYFTAISGGLFRPTSMEKHGLACAQAVAHDRDARIAELEGEEELSAHVIKQTTTLLAEVVVILRGPAPPLMRWGYHDIPELVASLKSERDTLQQRVADLKAQGVEKDEYAQSLLQRVGELEKEREGWKDRANESNAFAATMAERGEARIP